MAKNEFRKLSKLELVEMISCLMENEDKLKEEIELLKSRNAQLYTELERRTEILNRRQLIEKEAGSIAQEMVAMSGIFDKAQKVADRYVLEIKKLKELAEVELEEAKKLRTEKQ